MSNYSTLGTLDTRYIDQSEAFIITSDQSEAFIITI